MMKHFDSLFDLMDAFPNEQACVDHLRAIRWRDGEFCPHCGCDRIYHFSDGKTFKCGECKSRFSMKVGTIFEDTKLPLCKWFMAIWLITNHPKGIASTTLAKDLKITQKTAWFVLHRLRHAAATPSFNAPLDGTVEADTTYVRGKEKNKHADKKTPGSQGGAGKPVVLGMVKRDGELRAKHIDDGKAATLQAEISANVVPGSDLMTDENRAFKKAAKRYTHHAVNHSAGEYVGADGYAHTNTIESVWALLERQIVGIHHWVSDKHLDRYVQEMTWRWNHRALGVTDRVSNLFSCVERRLKYRELIA